uniref:Uncharacterized protein n=1 Tax=viral metagenome TaxID=1070528 RepID=A0A6M3LTR5_9ZZZZ
MSKTDEVDMTRITNEEIIDVLVMTSNNLTGIFKILEELKAKMLALEFDIITLKAERKNEE